MESLGGQAAGHLQDGPGKAFGISYGIVTPWALIGDFDILKMNEKEVESENSASVGTKLENVFNHLEVTDVKVVGCILTWSNKHTSCKLDRIVVNEEWLASYDDFIADFGLPDVSDHSPSVLRLLKPVHARRAPFKFKNLWVDNPVFKSIVEDAWKTKVDGYDI